MTLTEGIESQWGHRHGHLCLVAPAGLLQAWPTHQVHLCACIANAEHHCTTWKPSRLGLENSVPSCQPFGLGFWAGCSPPSPIQTATAVKAVLLQPILYSCPLERNGL